MRSLTDLSRTLNLRPPCSGLPRLVLVTDQFRMRDPIPVIEHLPSGSWVILRHADSAERLRLAHEILPICRRRRLFLLIAADVALAFRLRTGLHLPERMARHPDIRIRRKLREKSGFVLTAACHNRLALHRAALLNVTAALLSPVFPTDSHPGAASLGLLQFRKLLRGTQIPVYALGGVSARTAKSLGNSRIAGLAAVSGFGQSDR